jgi:hypothetical protein
VLHAALAGLYGAGVVLLILLCANPDLAAGGPGVPGILLAVTLAYAAAAGFVWPLLYGGLRFFASHRLRVPPLSLRYLMAFHVANGVAVLTSAWLTLSRGRRVIEPALAGRFGAACFLLSLAWLAAAAVLVVPVFRHSAPLLSAAGLASLVVLAGCLRVAARSPEGRQSASGPVSSPPQPVARLVLLNFDGADLDPILTLQAQGKLPAFARLRERGAYGRLRTILPCVAPVTRTTLLTGRRPYRHGVRGAFERTFLGRPPGIEVVPARLGFDALLAPFLRVRATSVADRRTLALFEMTAVAGTVTAAAGWEVDLDRGAGGSPGRAPAVPADDPASSRRILAEFLDPDSLRRAGDPRRPPLTDLLEAYRADEAVARVLDRLGAFPSPAVVALSFPGLDRVAHRFLRYAHPEEFGDVAPREVDLYGEVLERYYRRVDGLVGRAVRVAGRDGILVVTSSHGMAPLPLRRRLLALATGADSPSGSHEDGPDGLLFVEGPGIRPGPLPGKGALEDVAPTLLYSIDLPVARDLDGAILTGAFTPLYTLEHPVSVIASYERRP